MQNKNRDDDTCAPINRVAQNKNLKYFAFGVSVISLTISELMLEIHLESMQQTELRLNCFIINGGRSKVSPIVSRKKTAQIMSRNTCEFKTELMKLDIMVDKMKLFDYKNPKITAYLEISGTRSFLRCEKWECSISL